MERVISLTHATDIDGVGSAALIRMRYGVPLGRLFFTDYKRESLEYAERKITGAMRPKTRLIVADLAVGNETLGPFLRIAKRIRASGGKVSWFDHHPWTDEAERKLAPLCETAIFGENRRRCGAEITKDELGLKDAFTRRFCRIVHYSDFNIKPRQEEMRRTVGYYALSIAAYHLMGMERNTAALRRMAGVISGGRLLDAGIRRDAERFRKMSERELKSMLSNIYTGERIALGFAGHIQKTYACMKLIESTGKDIGIYVNLKDKRGHMRSLRSDVSALAALYGGGGHPHAAGFSPDFGRYDFRTEHGRRGFLAELEASAERLGMERGGRAVRLRRQMLG